MLINLQCYKVGVDNPNKLVMVMKNRSSETKVDCPRKGDSIDDFSKEKMSIIENNDTTLDVVGYLNVDELE